MSDSEELVFPVPVSRVRFKKLGAVQFSDAPYEQSPLLSTLPLTKSLLALSNRHGVLFLFSSSQSLFVASVASILQSVEEDRREQALAEEQEGGEAKEGKHKRVEDAAAVDTVWTQVHVDAADVWHVSLSSDEEWLLLMERSVGRLHHVSQFAKLKQGAQVRAMASFDSEHVIDVQWSPHQPRRFFTLTEHGRLTMHTLDGRDVHSCLLYEADHALLTSFLASTSSHNQIFLGHADGSLHMATLSSSASSTSSLTTTQRLPSHQPDDSLPAQPALHHISQLSSNTLILGYALYRSGDSSIDPERTALSAFSLSSSSYSNFGDLLQDEPRLMEEDANKPYTARHRYGLLPVPQWSCGVLFSNKSGDPAVIGKDPERPSAVVPYELESDAARMVVPRNAKYEDTFVLGMALDRTNTLSTADSVAEHKTEADVPFPMVFMLASDARLHLFSFISNEPTMKEASAQVMLTSVRPLPTSLTLSAPSPPPGAPSPAPVPLADAAEKESVKADGPSSSAGLPFTIPQFTFSTGAAVPTFSFGPSTSSSTSSSAPSLFTGSSDFSFQVAAPATKGPPSWSFESTDSAPSVPFSFFNAFSSTSTASSASFGGVSVALASAPARAASPPAPSAPTTFAALAAKNAAAGGWDCEVCEVHNDERRTVCASCETPRPAMVSKAATSMPRSTVLAGPAASTPLTSASSSSSSSFSSGTAFSSASFAVPSSASSATSSSGLSTSSSFPFPATLTASTTAGSGSSVSFAASSPSFSSAVTSSRSSSAASPPPSAQVPAERTAARESEQKEMSTESRQQQQQQQQQPAPPSAPLSSSPSSGVAPSVSSALSVLQSAVRSGELDPKATMALLDIVQQLAARIMGPEAVQPFSSTATHTAAPAAAAKQAVPAAPGVAQAKQPDRAPDSAYEIRYPPVPAPPAPPAVLMRPAPLSSQFTSADFRTPPSGSGSVATFYAALKSLGKDMELLSEIDQDTVVRLKRVYHRDVGDEELSMWRISSLLSQTRALEATCKELRAAVSQQEQRVEQLTADVLEELRDVEASSSLLARKNDPDWRALLLEQPLDSEAARMLDSLDAKLAQLRAKVDAVDGWVKDDWSRLKGRRPDQWSEYDEEDVSGAGIRRVIASHAAIIDKQRAEMRRLKELCWATTTHRDEQDGVRPLFSATPMKAIAGRKGWDREEEKKREDEGDGRLQAAAHSPARIRLAERSPIIGSALQSRGSRTPSTRLSASLSRGARSSLPASPAPLLPPSTIQQLNAAFSSKLQLGQRRSSLQPVLPRSEDRAQEERVKGRERLHELLSAADSPRFKAASFLSPLPSTLKLRAPPSASSTSSSSTATVDLMSRSGERRWSRTRFATPQQQADAEEKEEREEQRKAEEAAEQEKQQQRMQLQRAQEEQQRKLKAAGAAAPPSMSTFTPAKPPLQGGRISQKRLSPRKGAAASPGDGGPQTPPAFSFSPSPGAAPAAWSSSPATTSSSAAPPPAFLLGFKSPPPPPREETAPVEEKTSSLPVPAPAASPAPSAPSVAAAKTLTSGAVTPAAVGAVKPVPTSSAPVFTFPSASDSSSSPLSSSPPGAVGSASVTAAAAALSPIASAVPPPTLELPESPAFAAKKETVKPLPAAPAAAAASPPLAPRPAPASTTPLASLPKAATVTSSTSSPAALPSSADSTSSASAPSVPSLPSFSFSTSAAVPTFSFSTASAAPSFSFPPATSTTSAASMSAMASTPSAASASSSSLLSSAASSSPSFGFPASSPSPSTSVFKAQAESGFGLASLSSALSDASTTPAQPSFGFTSTTSSSPFGGASTASTGSSSAASAASPFAPSPFSSAPFASSGSPFSSFASPFGVSPASSSAPSLGSFASVFGASSAAVASSPFGSVFGSSTSNPFQTAASTPAPSNLFAPAQQSSNTLGQQAGFSSPFSASPPPFASSSFPSSTPSAADPFNSAAAFSGLGFGQSFSSAAFGGQGSAGSSGSSRFAPTTPSSFGFAAFGSGGGGAGAGFSAFAPQSGAAAPAGAGSGFGSFAAVAQPTASLWGVGGGGAPLMPQAPTYNFDTRSFRG